MTPIKSRLSNETMNGFLEPEVFSVDQWLFSKNCFLKDYVYNGEHAPEIITSYSKKYNINPKMVLARIQCEKSAISMTVKPDDIILNGICGVGYYDDGTIKANYQGFENQIAGCCAIFRKWYDYWKPDMMVTTTDGEKKYATQSAVTFSLLMYTDHVSALKTTEEVYVRYFNT